VTDLGSGTDVLTQYIAAKAGIQRSQYTTVAVGAGATAIAALQKGQVDCVMTTQPTVLALEKQGIATSTINLATTQGATAAIGASWPAASVLAKTSWVNSHKTEAQAVVDALLATMEWMHTHTPADVANALPPAFVQSSLSSKADYIAALTQDYDQFIWDGIMPTGGPESVQQSLTLTKQAKGGENLSTTYTNEFVNAAAKVVK
jgi:NitT/TauT family transport system substrate-binding protein